MVDGTASSRPSAMALVTSWGVSGTRAIRARGSSDDKGQIMTVIEACRAFKAMEGELPCGVTILIEGAEEILQTFAQVVPDLPWAQGTMGSQS